jgi:hypothetical protein
MHNLGFTIVGLVLLLSLQAVAWAGDGGASVNVAGSSQTLKSVVLGRPLNEMKGKLQAKSDDPKTLRLMVDGGFNVEFTYDRNTTMVNGGHTVQMSDLNYGDELIVRYAGKDLNAVEIDRVNKAVSPY